MQNNTITEDYVSFETAKLLAKKGFDIITEKCYILDNSGLCAVSVGQLFNGMPQGKYEIPAPTLQMAMKWLREVCGFFIQIKLSIRIKKNEYEAKIMSLQKKWTVIELVKYDTYEEIAEAAIKYCLTELIK